MTPLYILSYRSNAVGSEALEKEVLAGPNMEVIKYSSGIWIGMQRPLKIYIEREEDYQQAQLEF
jgi:hypothetical protein